MRPKTDEVSVVFGFPRFAWLKRLNTSSRNSSLCDSAYGIGKFLKTKRSTTAKPGPRSVLRPNVPNVPGAFSRKAAVLNQRAI